MLEYTQQSPGVSPEQTIISWPLMLNNVKLSLSALNYATVMIIRAADVTSGPWTFVASYQDVTSSSCGGSSGQCPQGWTQATINVKHVERIDAKCFAMCTTSCALEGVWTI